ncbi:unnamed protein product [Eruca vesicaria subsp. sativa]|uniref:ACB domain-containing protein n=1 Tax=Eruca vesicaria subsp. sativa TaxID=29727 RepID=A0ABC8J5Y1_ERUVS|nr:unnamed protein product [Eruca vesicaria subsp. sativa]
MEFFLEMLLTAVVAVLFSFLVAKLVSASMVGNSGGEVNDQVEKTEIGVGDRFVTVEEELCVGLKMDSQVVQSERRLRVVGDENVERVDRLGSEVDSVVDEVEEGAKGEDYVVSFDESLAAVSPGNMVAEETIVPGEEKVSAEFVVRTVEEAESTASVSLENVRGGEIMIRGQEEGSKEENVISGEVLVAESEEISVRTVDEAMSTASVSLENVRAEEIMVLGQEVRSDDVIVGEVLVAEAEEVSVEESDTVEESEHKMELNIREEGEKEEKDELSIEEEDDDWEGIERSELEKAFASASNLLEVSGKAEEIGDEVKMELYGLHKIATEGSCRETQPMAIMVSARAKWNAWQKLGNMSQEEAMEQYLELVSKEIPGLINTVGKIPVLTPNSGSLDDQTTLDTTGVAFTKNVSAER